MVVAFVALSSRERIFYGDEGRGEERMDRIFRRDGLSPVVKRELRNVRLENRFGRIVVPRISSLLVFVFVTRAKIGTSFDNRIFFVSRTFYIRFRKNCARWNTLYVISAKAEEDIVSRNSSLSS